MNTKLIRDSYRFEVWLPASLVQWLDARHPDDEPEVAIAKALKALQGRDRRSSERSIQILARPDYPPTKRPTAIEPTPVALPPVRLDLLQQSRMDEPISWLNQFCQLSRSSVPSFDYEPIVGGFRCRVEMLGRSGVGDGTNKREAKKLAAARLLEKLQGGQISN